jgi:hypothetical protein
MRSRDFRSWTALYAPHRTANGRSRYRPALEALEDRVVPADAVLDWNAVLLQANAVDHGLAQPDQPGPGRTARAFAIVHAAIYDAVNGIQRRFDPYLVAARAPHGADVRAAVAGAAYTTLVGLFPQQRHEFTLALADALGAIPNGKGETRGLAYGVFVGARHYLDRVNDGSGAAMTYTPTGEPGHHGEDPLHPGQSFLDPGWGDVRPFTMTDGSQFIAPPPPEMISPEYTAAYKQVYLLGAVDAETSDRDGDGLLDRSAEQTEIGIYWGYDGSPGLGTPPRLYNQIARAVAERAGNSLVDNARLFALLNLAQADAGITSWDTKYEYDFWRPIMAIRNADADGNPDTLQDDAWMPLGAPRSNDSGPGKNFTPNFPAYTSGHATFGAASFGVLAGFFGSDHVPGGPLTFVSDEWNGVTVDQNGLPRALSPRTFTTFSQMTQENAISRIYLGIHWSFDATAGINHGSAVADWVVHKYLQPLGKHHKSTPKAGGAELTATPVFVDGTTPETVVIKTSPVLSRVNSTANATADRSARPIGDEPAIFTEVADAKDEKSEDALAQLLNEDPNQPDA